MEPRRRSGVSRNQRADRAYKLTLATGGLAVVTVALVLLAILGIAGWGIAVLAAILTVIVGFLLRRTLNG